MRVSATGGAAAAVTTLGPQQQSHRYPHVAARRPPVPVLRAGRAGHGRDLPGRARRERPDAADARRQRRGVSARRGWLLWVRAGTLVAQRLDVAQAALTGEPVTLADGVAVDSRDRSAVSVAATGLVAYRTGAGSQRQLTWFDRSGTARGTVGEPDDNDLRNPRVSPDGRRVAVSPHGAGQHATSGCWTAPARAASRSMRRSTGFLSGRPTAPGSCSARPGRVLGDLYQKLTSGAGVEERLVASDQVKTPTSWSADGRFLLYLSVDPQTNADLWVVPMVGGSQAVGVPEDPLPRGLGRVLAGRPVGGLRVERIGAARKSTSGRLSRPARRARPRGRPGASGRCPRRAASFPSGGPTARSCTTSIRRAR